MKRVILILALLIVALSASGCGVAGSGTSEQSNTSETDNSVTETATQSTGATLQGCAGLVVAGSCNQILDANGDAAVASLPLAIAGVCANGWLVILALGLVCLIITSAGSRD